MLSTIMFKGALGMALVALVAATASASVLAILFLVYSVILAFEGLIIAVYERKH